MKQPLKFLIIVLVVVLIVPQIALAAWWNPLSWNWWGWVNNIFHFQQTAQQPVACPAVAKVCPDGSSVSPQGPKCEYPACPNATSLSDAYPLDQNLEWSNPSPKTVDYNGIKLSGNEIQSKITVTSGSVSMDIFSYYDKKLKDAGWTDALYFDADGVLGHQVGYKKGNEYISIGYAITNENVTSSQNEPLQWTYPYDVTYSIFIGSVVTASPSAEQACAKDSDCTTLNCVDGQCQPIKQSDDNGVCGPCGADCIFHAESASCPAPIGNFTCKVINGTCAKVQ